jgi:hypothetical protein
MFSPARLINTSPWLARMLIMVIVTSTGLLYVTLAVLSLGRGRALSLQRLVSLMVSVRELGGRLLIHLIDLI